MTTDTQPTFAITNAVVDAIHDGIQAIRLRDAVVRCLAIQTLTARLVYRPDVEGGSPVTTDGTSSIWGIPFRARIDVPFGTVRLIASDFDHIDIALERLNPQETAPTMSTTDPFASFRDRSRHRLPRIYVAGPKNEAVTSWLISQNLPQNRVVPVTPGSLHGAWPVADRDDVLVILPGVADDHASQCTARFRRAYHRAGFRLAKIVNLRSADCKACTDGAGPQDQVAEAKKLTGHDGEIAAFPLTVANQRKVAAGHLAAELERIDGQLVTRRTERESIDKEADRVDEDIERLGEIRAALERGAAELRGEHVPTEPAAARGGCF